MSWYKFRCSHGPGHASQSVEFIWMERPYSGWKQEMSEQLFGDCDWPVVRVTKLKALPDKEHALLVDKYKGSKNTAEYMLKILDRTPHFPCRHIWKGWDGNTCRKCFVRRPGK